MIRYISLTLTVLACVILGGANQVRGQNVLVDLTEDGTLWIVEEFVGGKNRPSTSINITTEDGVIKLQPNLTSLNGEEKELVFNPSGIQRIEVCNVNRLYVYAFPQPLNADLAISGAFEVEIIGAKIADLLCPGTGPGGIAGDVTIASGLGGSQAVIEDIDLFGDLSISTGHATDVIQFAVDAVSRSDGRDGPVEIHGDLTINTGQDWDALEFGPGVSEEWFQTSWRGTHVLGDVSIQMKQGSDYIFGEQQYLTVEGSTSISLGQQ